MRKSIRRTRTFARDAFTTFRLAVSTARWVTTEMFSPEGTRYMRYALMVYLAGTFLEQLAPYFLGKLVALHTGDTEGSVGTYIGLIALAWVSGLLLERLGNHFREWGWNTNARSMYYNVTERQFEQTPGEIMEEDRDIGANQIESCVQKMHRVQQTIYFEFSSIATRLTVNLGLIAYLDTLMGALLGLVLLLNVVALFFMNHYIHLHASTIDARMRQFHNRLVEYWQFAVIIISSGIQARILDWVRTESQDAFWDDYRLWGVWFQIVDGIRSTITNLSIAGIIYIGYFRWETDAFVASFAWILSCLNLIWGIGEVQRTLAENAERLHALREAFEKQPAFDHYEGITYQKGE